jgi:hypothetical protein
MLLKKEHMLLLYIRLKEIPLTNDPFAEILVLGERV